MAATGMIAIAFASFVVFLDASAGGQVLCARGSCPVARDIAMLQKRSLVSQHGGLLQRKRRDSEDKALDLTSALVSTAYIAELRRTVHAVYAAREPAKAEIHNAIDNVIDRVTAHQSDSEELCSAQLEDAQEQLNHLHDTINDVSTEINATQTAIRANDCSLSTKKEEETQVEQGKDDALKKCTNERKVRREMLDTAQEDLAELKRIAHPNNFTINLNTDPDSKGDALLEKRVMENKEPEVLSGVKSMMLVVKTAAAVMKQCIKTDSTPMQLDVSLIEAPAEVPLPKDCRAKKERLEKSLVKAYVKLTRVVAENEEFANSTSCEDTVHQEFKAKMAPIQKEISIVATELADTTKTLSELRPRLEHGNDAEKTLRDKVVKLSDECLSLPETVNDLNKIRDVIHVMDRCPGLGHAKFKMPHWIGKWVTVQQHVGDSDEALDARLNKACGEIEGVPKPVRAAEVGEILAISVVDMPLTNTAKESVLGACPHCVGEEDSKTGIKHTAGHARVCWVSDGAFSKKGMRKDCSTGLRAVLCVHDDTSDSNMTNSLGKPLQPKSSQSSDNLEKNAGSNDDLHSGNDDDVSTSDNNESINDIDEED